MISNPEIKQVQLNDDYCPVTMLYAGELKTLQQLRAELAVALDDELKKFELEPSQVLISEITAPLMKEFNVPNLDELLVQIGYGELSPYVAAKKARAL